MREFLSILGPSVLAAVAYGLVHDQLTSRVCAESFSVAHPPMSGSVHTDDPTVLALYRGVVATWWMGLLLGIVALIALAAGIAGRPLGRSGSVVLVGWFAEEIPPDRHARFPADPWVHGASYLVGFCGGLVLVVLVWRSRRGA